MNIDNIRINKLTCRFEDKELEQEYLTHRWNRIWKYVRNLLIISETFNMLLRIDDIRLLGPNPYYISYHTFSIICLIIFIFISNENKKKYHQLYFTVGFIGFMNCGVWCYYFSDAIFPVGPGVLPILTMLPLLVWPYHFINSVIVAFGVCIPFSFLLISTDAMAIGQMAYLIIIPLTFLIFNKMSNETASRVDFVKSKALESNRLLMQKTLKRYFGETLTEKILHNEGDLKGDNIWVSISFTDISSYSTIIEHMSPEIAVKFLNEYFSSMHDVIEEHNGHIVNYIGDSVMVVFGAPQKIEDHEIASVRCAIEMRKKLSELNKKVKEIKVKSMCGSL